MSNGFLIHIRTDILSILIWVQTVCKGYQQIINVAASRVKVNNTIADQCAC